jgi:hypothetical protein
MSENRWFWQEADENRGKTADFEVFLGVFGFVSPLFWKGVAVSLLLSAFRFLTFENKKQAYFLLEN